MVNIGERSEKVGRKARSSRRWMIFKTTCARKEAVAGNGRPKSSGLRRMRGRVWDLQNNFPSRRQYQTVIKQLLASIFKWKRGWTITLKAWLVGWLYEVEEVWKKWKWKWSEGSHSGWQRGYNNKCWLTWFYWSRLNSLRSIGGCSQVTMWMRFNYTTLPFFASL